jgi:hypothetical protein
MYGIIEKAETPPVGFLQIFTGEDLLGRTRSHHAHIQENHPVKVTGYRSEIVMHYKASFPLTVELFQNFDNRLLGRGIDCGKWFIHKIDLGILRKGSR